jgi:hypothetical protein
MYPRTEQDRVLADEEVRRPLSPLAWKQCNRIISAWLSGSSNEISRSARSWAEIIKENLKWLDPLFQGYVNTSYNRCQDPCCQATSIFFDRTDLLYLHSLAVSIPQTQTRIKTGDPCHYLAEQGCILPRIHRPYVCTWFMCDLHYECFEAEQPKTQREFLRRLSEIRHYRQKLSLLYDPKARY